MHFNELVYLYMCKHNYLNLSDVSKQFYFRYIFRSWVKNLFYYLNYISFLISIFSLSFPNVILYSMKIISIQCVIGMLKLRRSSTMLGVASCYVY